MQSKRFTVAEANETLSQIESIFERLEDEEKPRLDITFKSCTSSMRSGEKRLTKPNNPDYDDFQQHRRRIGYLKEDIF